MLQRILGKSSICQFNSPQRSINLTDTSLRQYLGFHVFISLFLQICGFQTVERVISCIFFFSQFHQTELHLLSCSQQCLSQSINKCIVDGLPINTPDVMCIAFHKSRHKYSLDIPFACLRMEMQPGGVSVRSETELLHPNVPVCFFFWQD